ncbi:vacuolar protein sorting-associated protein 41 [Trametes maxima]|nr:vacuolar protein sorting-associated protein 41 [Trametes maxima]
MLHILDLSGQHVKSFPGHSASVLDISVDITGDFIATASIDGQVIVHSLSGTETPSFNLKRPVRTVALEPNFAKSSTRSLVSGGMAGNLILHEKGWLGYKETVLHSGEGPIWQVRWRDNLIAWANDLGVKIYDTQSLSRITFIDRPADSPRADLFKCTLHWQDESTLLIGWADHIKVARIRARSRKTSSAPNLPSLLVEITAVFQLDCMISGIVPHPLFQSPPASSRQPADSLKKTNGNDSIRSTASKPPALTAFLVLAYTPPDTSLLSGNEATSDRAEQARKQAERPELRIVSRAGEELAADALGITNYERWNCNDYVLVDVEAGPVKAAGPGSAEERYYIVLSPKDLVVVKPRDWRDHVSWLVERQRYEEALEEIERRKDEADASGEKDAVDAAQIGQRYVEHLIGEGDFSKAARLCPKVCGQDTKRWEDWIFVFAQKHQLQAIIPYIPTESPTLGPLVYEIVLTHFLAHDRQALLQTIRTWPKGIYDIAAVIVAVQSELDRAPSSSSLKTTGPDTVILMECLAELYTLNRQPGKALPYFLRLRRPNVFDLIRENNLFTDVQDQALLLVEFDQELREKRKRDGEEVDTDPVGAITLLVDHIHSIPIGRVVQQLQARPAYLYLYLDALFHKDPHLTSIYADIQVKLYAEYSPRRLIDFLRASNYYSLEEAYRVCDGRDLVPEMVFLLGRMGNNKKALNLIIERLGDVNRAIDFAKEQHDDDLWEDLLRYSETRPPFIRGLLENVGAEIDPIRLIRRIKNGLEIPGLKGALIKILHDFNLQVSLLEGCQTIMDGDCADLVFKLHKNQTSGFFLSAKTPCPICAKPISQPAHGLALLFLCRHVVHAHCVDHGDELPHLPDPTLVGMGIGGQPGLSGKIAFTAILRAKITQGCPVCHQRSEGERTR